MEVPTNTGTPPPIAEGATNLSAPTPATTPTPIAANGGNMPPMGSTAPPVMEQGGIIGWAKNLNWVAIGFMMLGSAALLSVLYYHKQQLNRKKLVDSKMQSQIDELKMNVQSAMKKNYKEL